jgi:hypothetical protein
VRDLLFEPACLDQWVAGGRAWEEEPPPLRPACEPCLGDGAGEGAGEES